MVLIFERMPICPDFSIPFRTYWSCFIPMTNRLAAAAVEFLRLNACEGHHGAGRRAPPARLAALCRNPFQGRVGALHPRRNPDAAA